jgi:chromosome segregation ATPase
VAVELDAEIARLRASISRAAAATEITLVGRPGASAEHDLGSPLVEEKELYRQLAALRERVAVAEQRNEGPGALRAELATLLFFAKTLQADADNWRSTLESRIKELEWQITDARWELERLAAEREMLVRRRDALQARIIHTATRMAKRDGGESRRTLPVFSLGEGLTVCSISVFSPRQGLRVAKHWLVTLNDSRDDVLVRRE